MGKARLYQELSNISVVPTPALLCSVGMGTMGTLMCPNSRPAHNNFDVKRWFGAHMPILGLRLVFQLLQALKIRIVIKRVVQS